MLALILFIVLVAVVLGLVGFIVHGLFWLFIIGCVVLLLDLVFAGSRTRGGRRIGR